MRAATLFKWRDTVSRKVAEVEDIQGDIVCMLMNVGLWHCLHASTLAGSAPSSDEAVAEETSKRIYHALRAASAYFQHVERDQLKLLTYEPNTDFDERIVKCMAAQCLAEAQEVTTQRARKKGYKPQLVAGIARDEFDRFEAALVLLATMDDKRVGPLKSYLQFKSAFYGAFALCYTGIHLFQEEKVGASVKALTKATDEINKARELSIAYRRAAAKTSGNRAGAGSAVDETPEFTELATRIRQALDKSKHENSLIYHQKLPLDDEPMLPAQSLVKADVYQAPMASAKWAAAKWDPAKIPVRGMDKAADLASSDGEKLQVGAHHISSGSEDCTLL